MPSIHASTSSASKRHIVVTGEEEDAWTVYPTPGLVVKFRDVKFANAPKTALLGESAKLFVNIAHCVELPGPARDLEEDEVAKLIGKDQNGFKIPISVGDLESVEDKMGQRASKVDVLVNSTFFNKRIQQSEFFRQITLLIICEALESRHAIRVDPLKQVILKNKKCMGSLNSQRIRKKPKNDFHPQQSAQQQNDDTVMDADDGTTETEGTFESIFDSANNKPRNYRVQIIGGVFADIRVRIRDQHGNLVDDVDRITLKMNDDRCVVLLDRARTVADFFLPYRLLYDQANCEFEAENGSLIVKCPIDWSQNDE